MDCSDNLWDCTCCFENTWQPIGRTPAQDGRSPVNLSHGDLLGASRNGNSRWKSSSGTTSMRRAA
eukprot:4866882-Pleurochrysis_carterae.AAC.2